MKKSRMSSVPGANVRAALMVSVTTASLAPAAQVFAQQADAQQGIEEIIVTAQKRDQSLQDVPLAITALSSTDIERLNASDVRDLQFATPNLVVVSSNAALPIFGIRGISDVSRNPGYEQRVGVYVDGIWVGRSGASSDSCGAKTMTILPSGSAWRFLKSRTGCTIFCSCCGKVRRPDGTTLYSSSRRPPGI